MIKKEERGAAFLCSALREVFTEEGGHGGADMKDIQVSDRMQRLCVCVLQTGAASRHKHQLHVETTQKKTSTK